MPADPTKAASSARRQGITIKEFLKYENELRNAEEQKASLLNVMGEYGIKPEKEAKTSPASAEEMQKKVGQAIMAKVGGLQKKNVTSFRPRGVKKPVVEGAKTTKAEDAKQ